MVFTDLPLTQEFKTLGIDNYLWVQALFNHEELERLRGQQPNDPHQWFLGRIIRMGVIVRKLDLSHLCFSLNFYFLMFLLQFPSMFPLLTYSQSFFPYLPTTQDTQDKGEAGFDSTNTGNSLNIILWLRNLSRFPNCQGYSLRLTGTRGLVGEGWVEGVLEAFRG